MTREERYIEYDERIDRYLRNQMSDSERLEFEQDVDNDQELRERLVATALLVQGIAQEGMRREGQAQLDAIKQMSEKQFKNTVQGPKLYKTLMRWAAGVAALLALVAGVHSLIPAGNKQVPRIAQKTTKTPVKTNATMKKPAEPTLASLADKYNKPFANEPDEFVSIRQQIGGEGDMMAVVYDIDKIESPEYVERAMGAENAEVIKEMQQMYTDCTRWYKALAYLKTNDKESAVKELNELIDHGTVEELVNRATDLLKKLKE